jgi:hypothetical protein
MMNSQDLIIENREGKILRTIRWNGEKLFLVKRKANQRLEFYKDLKTLNDEKVEFTLLGELGQRNIAESPFSLPGEALIRAANLADQETVKDIATKAENPRHFIWLLGMLLCLGLTALFLLRFVPSPTESIKEELRQQLVKIVKRAHVLEHKMSVSDEHLPKKNEPKKISLKKMGALAALGNLSASKQRGGLNLGAINTSAGIGLGGTQGSGGTQTAIYATGVLSAPLGLGGKLNGSGGYGTKGKGGGQAGYGQVTLVGSAGTNAFAIEREVIVDGGLDREAIAEVVRRNQGQIMFCYEQGLQSSPGLNGRVAVRWTIGAEGQVKVASIESTTLMSQTVEECIVMRLKTWKFPFPQGAVDVSVTYPFVFKRAGQG